MASSYFSMILAKINITKEDRTKLDLYELDIKILYMFCSWLDKWDIVNVKETSESSRCIISALKMIWVEEEEEDFETWPKDVQDLDLERKIEQSKSEIEQWCQSSLGRSLIDNNNNAFTDVDINPFIFSVNENLRKLLMRYRDAEFVSFKNQMVILKEMTRFMCYSLLKAKNSEKLFEYRRFVDFFSNNAVWLICQYWAKEAANDDQMNILLFDLLHKIKPYAPILTVKYCYANKGLSLSDDEEGESLASFVARFVDFFYQHTIFTFPIVRERLIVLFTFLVDFLQGNLTPEGEGLLNLFEQGNVCILFSEVDALLRKDSDDAYLLLSLSETEEDFSNNCMLLIDFMIEIDKLTDEVIQLYCRNKEAEKMNNIYFASLERELYSFKQEARWWHNSKHPVLRQVDTYISEVRFLKVFLQCFETWDDSDEETRERLTSVVTSLENIWGTQNNMGLVSGRLYAIRKEGIANWKCLLDLELKEKFQMSNQQIKAWLSSLSHYSFRCRLSKGTKILKFLDSILCHIGTLSIFLADCIPVPLKKQIEFLETKLFLLNDFLKLAMDSSTSCADSKNIQEFNKLAHVVINNAACLIYLIWAEETIPEGTDSMISYMLQKIKPDTPDVARMYIETLKAICLQPYDSLLFEGTAMRFVDYFFEDVSTLWKNDFQILQDEVMFHFTFIHHHHHYIGNAHELIYSQLDVLFNDRVYDLLPFDDMIGDFSKKNAGLSDFMMNIRAENAKIKQLYCKFTDSFLHNFPRIIGQGFHDYLLEKLRNLVERMISDQLCIPIAKCKIMKIEEELVHLTPILNQILELKDLNDAWLEVVNVIYLAEHVISLCCMYYHQIWHYVPYISDVIDRIKVIRTKIEECNMNSTICLSQSSGVISTPLLQLDQTLEMQGVLVGMELDEKIIIENIMGGTNSFDIVSIVGMGGLGKTTLARKVYDSVKSHFNIFAFSYVSQHHNKRKILLDILRDIIEVDEKTSCMTEDDLAHKLKKCLSRRKYLIILDDIWNINVWDEVRSAFPDDKNGSRVMLTTRSLEVAKKCQIICSPHQLHFLSVDESWELLQKKVFHNEIPPPPDVYDVAKLVAKKCDGLPLAIVVIAGVLGRTKRNLWTEISKNVSSYLFDEGCMSILELSYNHLPEYLRPCLIYLGAFPRNTSFRVKQVTLLWIDEGFIKESKTKSLNDVAEEYLNELVYRSLVIVGRMIVGEIDTFRVHDLIHDMCEKKCRDQNFFHLGHRTAATPLIYNHYRISVQKVCDITADDELSLTNTRSLLCFLSKFDHSHRIFPLRKFRCAQVLYLKGILLQESDFAQVTSLIDLRHIEAEVTKVQSVPASISDIWDMKSLILKSSEVIDLPETLWKMKSLRHVKVHSCKFEVPDEVNAYPPQLDKVVSFSKPCLSSGKGVGWLLQRLPAVQKLSCILDYETDEGKVETFDFHRKLESLKLWNKGLSRLYLINYPSSLTKLTLKDFEMSWTAISRIAELECLRILKLKWVNFPGPTWEMDDMTFPNLKYFELTYSNLELWNADFDSFPCLEDLYFYRSLLEELPPCFGEISSLKKITIWDSRKLKLKSSALWVQEEQMSLGNKVELDWKCVR